MRSALSASADVLTVSHELQPTHPWAPPPSAMSYFPLVSLLTGASTKFEEDYIVSIRFGHAVSFQRLSSDFDLIRLD